MMPETRTCPECNGLGEVELSGGHDPYTGERYYRDTCPLCDGDGEITVEPIEEEDAAAPDHMADYRHEMISAERYDIPGCRWLIPGCIERAHEALEAHYRAGEQRQMQLYEVQQAQIARLLELYPGFTLQQIVAGLTVPACDETKP
jgi:hypothetical protein